MFHRMYPFALTALLGACAPDLRTPSDGATDLDAASGDGGMTLGRVSTSTNADGTLHTVVNASVTGTWVYVDLDGPTMASESMEGWDLAFERFQVMSNGGVSGAGGVQVAILDGQALSSVHTDDGATWLTDAPADGGMTPSYVFDQQEGWYNYDPATHTLTPRTRTFLVRTTSRRVVALQIADYYDSAGTSGYPSFDWVGLPR